MHYLGAVMTAVPGINIASSTSSNWLAEAQTAMQAPDGGMMGALQTATAGPDGSIKSFLATSQSNADAFASIAQSSVQAAGQFYAQLAATEGQQAAEDRQAKEAALLNPPAQTNYTPPRQLDPVVYYDDGSSLDTTSNIHHQQYHDAVEWLAGRYHHWAAVHRSQIDHRNGERRLSRHHEQHPARGRRRPGRRYHRTQSLNQRLELDINPALTIQGSLTPEA